MGKKKDLGPALEAFNTIRTNLGFLCPDRKMKVFLVTSCVKGEGKTLVACNIANAYASVKNKVLLIDCDLRDPSVNSELEFPFKKGLAELIAEKEEEELTEYLIEVNGYLDVLPAGALPENVPALLSSKRLGVLLAQFRELYDIIILDTPPVLLVSDALLLRALADGVLMVIKDGYTTKTFIKDTKRVFDVAGIKPTACILNAVSDKKSKGKYYGYASYLHKGSDEKKQKSATKTLSELPVDQNAVMYSRQYRNRAKKR